MVGLVVIESDLVKTLSKGFWCRQNLPSFNLDLYIDNTPF